MMCNGVVRNNLKEGGRKVGNGARFTLLQPVAERKRNKRREIGRQHMHVKGHITAVSVGCFRLRMRLRKQGLESLSI